MIRLILSVVLVVIGASAEANNNPSSQQILRWRQRAVRLGRASRANVAFARQVCRRHEMFVNAVNRAIESRDTLAWGANVRLQEAEMWIAVKEPELATYRTDRAAIVGEINSVKFMIQNARRDDRDYVAEKNREIDAATKRLNRASKTLQEAEDSLEAYAQHHLISLLQAFAKLANAGPNPDLRVVLGDKLFPIYSTYLAKEAEVEAADDAVTDLVQEIESLEGLRDVPPNAAEIEALQSWLGQLKQHRSDYDKHIARVKAELKGYERTAETLRGRIYELTKFVMMKPEPACAAFKKPTTK